MGTICIYRKTLWTGTVFLELWKRYSAVLTHSWGFTGYTDQAEHPRPRYLEKLSNSKHKKLNVVTNRVEPVVPFWAVKVPITFFSYTVILFFVSILQSYVTLYHHYLPTNELLFIISLVIQSEYISLTINKRINKTIVFIIFPNNFSHLLINIFCIIKLVLN